MNRCSYIIYAQLYTQMYSGVLHPKNADAEPFARPTFATRIAIKMIDKTKEDGHVLCVSYSKHCYGHGCYII